jgi:uncharacterized membrane protein YgdD (TMEM256/DUF423 family)
MGWIRVGAALGALGVMIGAFGAHGLKDHLKGVSDTATATFETGVKYHFFHALALLAVGLLAHVRTTPDPWLSRAGLAFLFGVVVFSGSLYANALTGIKTFGMTAPIGGAALIFGWVAFFLAARS